MSAAGFEALLGRPMRAVEDAAPLNGPFPLIVIGLGLYYESPITFAATAEYLAGRGFVVATAPLVGTHSAIVRLTVPELETQIRDLEFVIARARQFSFVDPDRLGVMGFDLGGMAGVVLAMRRDVDAFVSLDSGIQYPHPSGLPRSSPHYDPLALRAAWLRRRNGHALLWLHPSEIHERSPFETAIAGNVKPMRGPDEREARPQRATALLSSSRSSRAPGSCHPCTGHRQSG